MVCFRSTSLGGFGLQELRIDVVTEFLEDPRAPLHRLAAGEAAAVVGILAEQQGHAEIAVRQRLAQGFLPLRALLVLGLVMENVAAEDERPA